MAAASDDAAAVRQFRQERAKSEAPRVLFWIGLALFVLTVLNVVVGLLSIHAFMLHTSISVIVWAAGWAISRPWFLARWVAPLTGACALLVIAEFEYEYWSDPTAIGFAYLLMIMLGSGPIILSPRIQALLATCGVLGSVVIIRNATPASLAGTTSGDWVIAAATAEIIGFILLYQRLRSIDALGAVTRRSESLANTDALTGLHNRHGMMQAMAALLEKARAAGDEVHVAFVDIDWLKTANDKHGHEFGDAVILAVANAVRVSLCNGEHAIARWGGDEFLIVGTGPDNDSENFTERVLAHVRASGLDLTKWSGSVSVGSAGGPAATVNLQELIELADARMYERRRAHRAQS